MQSISISAESSAAKGTPGDGQADAAEHALHDGGDADTERHAADRLTGQNDSILAALAGQPAAKAPHARGPAFTAGVEDRREHDDEQELQQHEARPPTWDSTHLPDCAA